MTTLLRVCLVGTLVLVFGALFLSEEAQAGLCNGVSSKYGLDCSPAVSPSSDAAADGSCALAAVLPCDL